MKAFFKSVFNGIKQIFIPSSITIDDGTVVVPPKPILPYILILFVLVFHVAAKVTNFSLVVIFSKLFNFKYGPFSYVSRFFPVDWAYWSRVVDPILETVQMSFLGSLIGAIFAFPAAYFASQNIIKSKLVVNSVRLFLSVTRTLPILVYASFFKLIFGLGALAGTIAIAVFTFAIVSKMLYERIETLDMGGFIAIQSTGASKIRSFITAFLPSVLPIYLSISLYAFEINIRYAAILGYVGAGGIGFDLDNAMKIPNNNDRIIVIILFIFLLVIIIENTSRFLRKRL